jgi:general stress protein 26
MSEKKLAELIHDVSIAMFTTVDAQGLLRSRPLTTLTNDDEDDEDLWFFSYEDSAKIDEIAHETQVNLAYAEPSEEIYVSVSGTAQNINDRALIHRFWKPMHKAFFPEGPDDPQLTLIRVRVLEAEYWDAPSSKMVILAGMAKAMLTGTAYRPGENEKVRVRPGTGP